VLRKRRNYESDASEASEANYYSVTTEAHNIKEYSKYQLNPNTLNKDFTCTNNAFLTIKPPKTRRFLNTGINIDSKLKHRIIKNFK
jgi:hypothetical protein